MKKKPAPEWIAVEDQLPECDTLYATYNTETKLIGKEYLYVGHCLQFVKKYTHYMEWVKYIYLLKLPK